MKRFYVSKRKDIYQVWDRLRNRPISVALTKQEATQLAKKFQEKFK